MVFLYFVLAAAVTVFAAIKLSKYADVISEKSTLGGMLVGTLLLAGATSLPEVTTSFSAGLIGNADIAVGNVFGSNLFNLFILGAFDFAFRRRKLLEHASYEHTYTALIGLLLTSLALTFLFLDIDATLFGVGLDVLLLIVVYAAGLLLINRLPKPLQNEGAERDALPDAQGVPLTVKQAALRFAFASLLIMAAGTALSVTGDQLAVVTGLGSSFVGSFLIAATTSLPEAVAVYVALQLSNINLALGSILGSNMFNMIILGVSDIAYQQGSILSAASGSHAVIASGVIFMSLLTLFMLRRNRTKTITAYSIPSLLILIGYFAVSYLNFTY